MNKNYRETIKELRLIKGKTQNELATELNIGRTGYTKIENGRQELDIETAIKLANYFNISLDQLFSRTPINQSNNLSNDEIEIIKKYRQLDADGKNLIKVMINTRLQQLLKTSDAKAI